MGYLRVARADREAVFPTPPPPRILASVNVLGIGAGRNPGCLTSEKVPFKLAKNHCQGRKPPGIFYEHPWFDIQTIFCPVQTWLTRP